jgi:hypothetical protein
MPLWRSAVHPDKIIFTRGKFSRLRGTGEFAEARQSIVHRRTARERSCRMERFGARTARGTLWAFGSLRIGACQTVMYIAIERMVVNKDNSLVMRYGTVPQAHRPTGLRQSATVGLGGTVGTGR